MAKMSKKSESEPRENCNPYFMSMKNVVYKCDIRNILKKPKHA